MLEKYHKSTESLDKGDSYLVRLRSVLLKEMEDKEYQYQSWVIETVIDYEEASYTVEVVVNTND